MGSYQNGNISSSMNKIPSSIIYFSSLYAKQHPSELSHDDKSSKVPPLQHNRLQILRGKDKKRPLSDSFVRYHDALCHVKL